jgi:uncharacterized protein
MVFTQIAYCRQIMRSLFCILLLLPFSLGLKAQTYEETIRQFRKQYTSDLLADKRAPIRALQVKNLSFFGPDENFRVWADFTETPGSKPMMIPTHSGKDKPFREYGKLEFTLGKSRFTLHVYQMMDMVKEDAHKDDLFLPFNDETNYETTFAGGRYIDLSVKDIQNGRILLDFNKCYNPYCAYADGYSCPIPPRENYLNTEINAGEKTFYR